VNGRYTVQAGDNLSRMAALFSTTVEEIVAAHRLANPHAIAAGDRLIIPGASPRPVPGPNR
jgi:LysM repeat protein